VSDRRDGDITDDAQAAHDRAVAAGEAGYLDPVSGLFVLTARLLADRGFCCRRGCRHCPYDNDDEEPVPCVAPG
jgi:hypothetical protein